MRGDTAGQSREIREESGFHHSASDLQESGEFTADGPAAPHRASPFHHCDETSYTHNKRGQRRGPEAPTQPWGFIPEQLREIWLKIASLSTYIYSKMV